MRRWPGGAGGRARQRGGGRAAGWPRSPPRGNAAPERLAAVHQPGPRSGSRGSGSLRGKLARRMTVLSGVRWKRPCGAPCFGALRARHPQTGVLGSYGAWVLLTETNWTEPSPL